MTDPTEATYSPPASRRVRLAGAILWPSFFAAGVATMVFFAFVDPIRLAEISHLDWNVSRQTGYSIGFFLFWAATAASSLFTTWLQQTPPSGGQNEPQ